MDRALQGFEISSLGEEYPEQLRWSIGVATNLRSETAASRAQITHQTWVDSRATFPEKRYQALVGNELTGQLYDPFHESWLRVSPSTGAAFAPDQSTGYMNLDDPGSARGCPRAFCW